MSETGEDFEIPNLDADDPSSHEFAEQDGEGHEDHEGDMDESGDQKGVSDKPDRKRVIVMGAAAAVLLAGGGYAYMQGLIPGLHRNVAQPQVQTIHRLPPGILPHGPHGVGPFPVGQDAAVQQGGPPPGPSTLGQPNPAQMAPAPVSPLPTNSGLTPMPGPQAAPVMAQGGLSPLPTAGTPVPGGVPSVAGQGANTVYPAPAGFPPAQGQAVLAPPAQPTSPPVAQPEQNNMALSDVMKNLQTLTDKLTDMNQHLDSSFDQVNDQLRSTKSELLQHIAETDSRVDQIESRMSDITHRVEQLESHGLHQDSDDNAKSDDAEPKRVVPRHVVAHDATTVSHHHHHRVRVVQSAPVSTDPAPAPIQVNTADYHLIGFTGDIVTVATGTGTAKRYYQWSVGSSVPGLGHISGVVVNHGLWKLVTDAGTISE